MAEPAARDGAGALKTRPGRGSVDAFLAQQDPARRAELGANGRRYAEAELSQDVILRRFEAQLLALVQGDAA